MAYDDKSQNPPSKATERRQVAIATIDIADSPLVRDPPLDEAIVQEFAEAMRNGAVFPPIDLFDDGSALWLGGGAHRIEATRRIGKDVIWAWVRFGTRDDCAMFAVGSNGEHGRTDLDKRRVVKTALQHSFSQGWSNRKIAQACKVSDWLVAAVQGQLQGPSQSPQAVDNTESRHQPARPVVSVDGKTRDVSRQGPAAQRTRERERLTAVAAAEPAAERPLSFEDTARTAAAKTQKAAKATERDDERLARVVAGKGQAWDRLLDKVLRVEDVRRWWRKASQADRHNFDRWRRDEALDSERRQSSDDWFKSILSDAEKLKHDEVVRAWIDEHERGDASEIEVMH